MSGSNMTHIVVGCGGTGAKSAYRLAELMSRHPYWHRNMASSVFFVLIDTDAGDLDRFVQSIQRVTPHNTFVTSIQTTQGFNATYEVVREFEDALRGTEAEDAAVRRFAEHWWAQNPRAETVDEAKFFVPNVKSIQTGAGQVPMVSFLASWYAMRENPRSSFSIERVVRELLDDIGNKRATIKTERGSPLDQFNVMFLGSVAGGTGRGCATPIAFKLKEMIHAQYKAIVDINGFFLNEDCFESLNFDEYERLNQMINAMTGWSELSSWIELNRKNPGKGYRYALPGPQSAHSTAHDALGRRNESDPLPDQGLAIPFDWLGVICKTAGSGFSASPDDLYGMLATSLYMEITESNVKSKRVNRNAKYFSVGSAIIEVDAEAIERFFRDKARWDAATGLRAALPSPEDVEKEVDRVLDLLGLSPTALDELLKPVDDPKTVLQKLSGELTSGKGGLGDRVHQLVSLMQDQDAEGAKEELRKLLSNDALDELAKVVGVRHTRLLANVLGEKLKRDVLGIDDIAQAVVDLLIADDQESLFFRRLSARAVAQVADRVQKRLKAIVEANGILSDEMVQSWKRQAGRLDPTEVLEAASKRGGFLGMGKRFKPEEIDEVTNAVIAELMCQAARALGRALGMASGQNKADGLGLINAISARLVSLAKSSDSVCRAVDSVVSDLDLSAEVLQKRQEQLFARPDRLESSIPTDDTSYLTRRAIKPLMPVASDLELRAAKLQSTVRELLLADEVGKLKDRDDLEFRVTQPISEAVLSVDYGLKPDSSSHNVSVPILNAFELQSVLRRLARAWPDYLSRLRQEDSDRFKSVEQDIERFYGLSLDIKRDSVGFEDKGFKETAGADYLMLAMATVAARSCRPFWRTRGTQAASRNVMVQVPADLGRDLEKAWASQMKEGANLNEGTVQILSNQTEDDRFNPYALIVYASSDQDSLEEVTSLDAWSENPQIRTALEKAEGGSPLMPFLGEEHGMWKGYRGSGFTDPIYVTHPELAKSRWRPWFRQASAEEDQTVMLALLYGWAGPEWFIRQKFPDSARGSKTVGPVFKFGHHASICIARRPCVFKEGLYSRAKPFDFPVGPGKSIGKMSGEGDEVGESLNAVLQLLGPDGSSSAEMIAFRDGLVEEYQTFFREIGDTAGFDPKRDRKGYLEMLEALAQYVSERLDGKRFNDPEHPFVGELDEEDAAEGKRSSKEFWGAAAEAVSVTIERYRRLVRE